MTEAKVRTEEIIELLRQLPPIERLPVVARVLPDLEQALRPPASQLRRFLRGLWRGLDISDGDIRGCFERWWPISPQRASDGC